MIAAKLCEAHEEKEKLMEVANGQTESLSKKVDKNDDKRKDCCKDAPLKSASTSSANCQDIQKPSTAPRAAITLPPSLGRGKEKLSVAVGVRSEDICLKSSDVSPQQLLVKSPKRKRRSLRSTAKSQKFCPLVSSNVDPLTLHSTGNSGYCGNNNPPIKTLVETSETSVCTDSRRLASTEPCQQRHAEHSSRLPLSRVTTRRRVASVTAPQLPPCATDLTLDFVCSPQCDTSAATKASTGDEVGSGDDTTKSPREGGIDFTGEENNVGEDDKSSVLVLPEDSMKPVGFGEVLSVLSLQMKSEKQRKLGVLSRLPHHQQILLCAVCLAKYDIENSLANSDTSLNKEDDGIENGGVKRATSNKIGEARRKKKMGEEGDLDSYRKPDAKSGRAVMRLSSRALGTTPPEMLLDFSMIQVTDLFTRYCGNWK